MPITKSGRSAGQHTKWRESIDVAAAIKKVNDCIQGTVELSQSQVACIKVALNKSLPDLRAMEISGGSEPVRFTWAPALVIQTELEASTDIIDVTPNLDSLVSTKHKGEGREPAPQTTAKTPQHKRTA